MSDYERPFFRCKRALNHLMHKDHDLAPSSCSGCREVALFLTMPGYHGETDYPVGVDFERPW